MRNGLIITSFRMINAQQKTFCNPPFDKIIHACKRCIQATSKFMYDIFKITMYPVAAFGYTPGTLNDQFLMDVWLNNHFPCKDVESSN